MVLNQAATYRNWHQFPSSTFPVPGFTVLVKFENGSDISGVRSILQRWLRNCKDRDESLARIYMWLELKTYFRSVSLSLQF